MSFPNKDVSAVKDLSAMLATYEKLLVLTTLNQYQWHRQRVAKALNIDRKTLFNKMKRHGLTSPNKNG
jgi:DNA-binding NtrC family response regulator